MGARMKRHPDWTPEDEFAARCYAAGYAEGCNHMLKGFAQGVSMHKLKNVQIPTAPIAEFRQLDAERLAALQAEKN